MQNRSWLIDAGRNGSGPREAYFKVNNILGLVRACQQGLGIAALPNYDGQRCALLTTKSRNTCTRATDFNSSG